MENKLLKDRGWTLDVLTERIIIIRKPDIAITISKDNMGNITILYELEENGYYGATGYNSLELTLEEIHGINQIINQIKYEKDAIEPIEGGVNHDRYEV